MAFVVVADAHQEGRTNKMRKGTISRLFTVLVVVDPSVRVRRRHGGRRVAQRVCGGRGGPWQRLVQHAGKTARRNIEIIEINDDRD